MHDINTYKFNILYSTNIKNTNNCTCKLILKITNYRQQHYKNT